MPAAPLPANELERLTALLDLDVLDTPAESEFDAIVQAAALVCDAPVSLISLVDAERQWFKANIGLPGATETPRDMAFCAYAIHEDGIFEISDATKDPRFVDNPLVNNKPNIRFYAGASLTTSNGANVGTLCVIDNKPHVLDQRQRAVLGHLAKAAVKALESRRALITEHRTLKQISRMANQLSESEARFRTLSDASPLGVFATDLNGKCTYTNNRWQEIYGLSLEQSLGDGWVAGLHPEDLANVFETWNRFAPQAKEFDMEFRVQHADGSIRFVHSRAKPITTQNNGTIGWVGSVEDVTEHKQAVRENNLLLDTIRAQFIMSIANLQGDIIEVNDAFCKISQYSREELVGQNHRIINSGVHPTAFFRDMWQTILQGKSWRGQVCNRAKDGSLYWVDSVITPLADANGDINRFVSIRSDITANKHAQHELLEEQRYLASVIEGTGAGTWEWNIQTGRARFNERWANILGFTLAELEPISIQTWQDLAHPKDLLKAQQLLKQHFAGETDTYECELRMRNCYGNWVWILARGRVLTWTADGHPEWMFGTHLDTTELVQQRLATLEARDRMSLATDSGEIGVWEFDVLKETLVWDSWMYRLYGYAETYGEARESESYQLWLNHLHPDDVDIVKLAVKLAIQGIRDFNTEFRIIWQDGSTHHLRATARVIRDEQGNALKMVGVNWDVTHLRQLASQLAEQHELLRVTLQSIGDAVITTDADGNVTWLNPIAERMTGWTTDEAQTRPLTHIFQTVHQETRLPTENPVASCLEQGKIVGLANHTVLISRQGDEYGIEDSAAPIRNNEGELLGVVLVFHDVTEQRRLSGEISYQASHDTLTGLLNRTEFEARLRRVLHRAHEDKTQHALMFIDLDQFKIVNDTCGHSAGDELLQQVAKILNDTVRNRDTLARLGGDEFGVILEHCSTDQAQRVAQQLCDKMENFRFNHDDHRFRIGTSIGLVPLDNRWPTTAALMRAADTSCYAAKEAGRNRVHVWFDTDQAMRARHGEMQWATRIEQALDENRFVLYAQHINDLGEDASGFHAEVLLRMVDSDGTMVPPSAFIPAAERFHLAARIDRWVLRHAIDWLISTKGNAQTVNMLAINLSGQSIGDRAFHRQAIEMLSEAGHATCSLICLEITETAAITNLADASLFIDQVSKLGVRVALDDFGAGASSFGYLKNLSVDILKIDGQFIKDLLEDPLDDVAVRCFVDVAKVVGLKTIAEFVDNPAVLKRVRELGVDYAQGFMLHKPEPIHSILHTTANINLQDTQLPKTHLL